MCTHPSFRRLGRIGATAVERQGRRGTIPFKGKDDKHAPPEPIRFTWWVIGRRKDIKGPRFREVKIPPLPKLP